MRILYGIQCTGNGHITRSKDIIEELRKFVQVDVLTSGGQNDIELDVPVKYKYRGMSYHFGKKGNIGYMKTFASNNFLRLSREIKEVPIKEYDMVISDFEPITAWAAKRENVYSVSLSNQASLQFTGAPKPARAFLVSKWITDYFCPSERQYGLFYNKFTKGVFYPPIREEVANLRPRTGGGIVVYLPFYSDALLKSVFRKVKSHQIHVFSKRTKRPETEGNVHFYPVGDIRFLHYLERCDGVICSSGFSLTSEAVYLGKKLLTIPMKNQYEQQCNAKFLEENGATVMRKLPKKKLDKLQAWLDHGEPLNMDFQDEKHTLVRTILEDYVVHTRFFKSV